jgi:hypothetical protein
MPEIDTWNPKIFQVYILIFRYDNVWDNINDAILKILRRQKIQWQNVPKLCWL